MKLGVGHIGKNGFGDVPLVRIDLFLGSINPTQGYLFHYSIPLRVLSFASFRIHGTYVKNKS